MLIGKNLMKFIMGGYLAFAVPSHAEDCTRYDIKHKGLDLTSAAWDAQKQSIYLVSAISKKVTALSWNGDGTLNTELDPPSTLRPTASSTKRADGGYVQVDYTTKNGPSIFWLENDFSVRSLTKLESTYSRSEKTLQHFKGRPAAIVDWVLYGDTAFAYGTLSDPSHPTGLMENSFFIHELRSPGKHNLVPKARDLMYFPDYSYYMLGLPYIASSEHRVYFLAMSSFPELYNFDFRTPKERPVQLNVSGISLFDKPLTPINNADMYGSISRQSMPAGLYTNDHGALFLLYREYQDEDDTIDWWLYELNADPTTGQVEIVGEKRQLPIQKDAKHVTLLNLPELSSWVAFELGASAKGTRRGDILGMVKFSQEWMASKNSKACVSVD